ncbi:putative ABC transport system ATP-binding protein [Silicimonas algicola]|uniref:Putative ABC transport system ATP-binding protein n=2 Tax=Silicimonas algicola TaxID=1826607 RepID=A0A316GRY9_9RHOB|nr:putative ABC transport system ATP-binding protein [Silicimonas algicola]
MQANLRHMLLAVRDLVKRFPGAERPVLDGISLDVEGGEIVALTGESGSGKSTLLHVVAGLEPADIGHVLIDGQDLTEMDDRGRAALRRSDIGIVFQQFNLIPSLSVARNLAFQARLAGRAEEAQLDALALRLGLTDHLAKYPEELSGGQQQRVAIGRAVAGGPRLLMADEPTGNLDEATGDTVMDLLVSLARTEGTALLVATHSQRLAARADRRLHLSRGRLA